MNRETLKGQWKQLRGEVKSRWGKITDNELIEVEGDYDKFVGVLQEQYGIEKEQAETELDEWLTEHPETARVLKAAGRF